MVYGVLTRDAHNHAFDNKVGRNARAGGTSYGNYWSTRTKAHRKQLCDQDLAGQSSSPLPRTRGLTNGSQGWRQTDTARPSRTFMSGLADYPEHLGQCRPQ